MAAGDWIDQINNATTAGMLPCFSDGSFYVSTFKTGLLLFFKLRTLFWYILSQFWLCPISSFPLADFGSVWENKQAVNKQYQSLHRCGALKIYLVSNTLITGYIVGRHGGRDSLQRRGLWWEGQEYSREDVILLAARIPVFHKRVFDYPRLVSLADEWIKRLQPRESIGRMGIMTT